MRGRGLTWLVLLCVGALSACATGERFTRTDARTCLRSTPARVCLDVDVDRGERLVAGAGEHRLVLLPGECAEGSSSELGRAGLRLRIVSATSHEAGRAGRRRVVPLAPGHVTEVQVTGERRRVTTRMRSCEGGPPT